jgi:phosphoribosyl-AMP cyclohydrolase
MKGESSGNKLKVLSLVADCDEDTILIRVRREGAGVVCHLGTVSCFAAAQEVLRAAGEPDDFGKAC